MKMSLDSEAGTLTYVQDGELKELPLYSDAAFALLSRAWVRTGWALKYSYGFSWLGRPVVQLPEDLLRIQELIHTLQPDVVVETGIAHGGSLVYYASLLEMMGKGRVIGVDIEIRAHNREALDAHPLRTRIELVEGDSVAPDTVAEVKSLIRPWERVLVILDSCHTKDHVARELAAYAPMVTDGSWIVATDGIMGDLSDVPGGDPGWTWDNPTEAAAEFAASHPEFELCPPPRAFDERQIAGDVTYWPGAYLRRRAVAGVG